MEKLTIYRSKWARAGGRKGSSSLLNIDGNMCCLGFMCQAQGVKHMAGKGNPADVWEQLPSDSWMIEADGRRSYSRDSNHAMHANDRTDTSDAEKEKTIAEIFYRNGVALAFED